MVVSKLAPGRGYKLLLAASTLVVNARRLALKRRFLGFTQVFRSKIRFLPSPGITIALLFLLQFSAPPLLSSDVKEPKRVLILYSFDKEQGIYAGLDEALRATLKARLPYRVEFYTEYLDLVRFADHGHADNLVKLLQLRLAEEKPDLIIPMSFSALNFLLNSGKDLFPDVPIVALFSERRTADVKARMDKYPLITAVQGRDEVRSTLDLALRLQPDTQRVVVVVGNSPLENFFRGQVQTEFAAYKGGITFSYPANVPMDALLKQLTDLPPHTIVLYTFFFQDAGGEFYVPEEALDLITRTSRVPVYGIYLDYVGHGIVGGCMEDPEKTGAAIAGSAVRVLRGEKPADIPMVVDSPSRNTVDWRQLRRWGISEKRFPPGGVALFREQSLWDRYRPYVIGSVLLILVQALLILALLVHRRQRLRAEERLLSEKAFSDAVIESLPGIFFMQDETLKNVRWNRNAEKIVRYHPSQSQRQGNTVEKYRGMVQQKIREVLETGGPGHSEIELLGQGDATYHYHFSSHRVELEGNHYVIGTGIDISERKRAEDELRLSEARFFSAFEYAPIGMALVSPEGNWIKVNQTLCALLGYTPEELQKKTFQDVTHPDDLEADLNYVGQMLTGEISSYQTEKRYFHKTGRVVWIWLSVSLVRDGKGQPLYFIAQIQDFTERKRGEEALKQAEERFAKAFRSNPEGFSISTLRDGRYLEVNESFLHMMGYERSEVIGKTAAELGIWEDSEQRSAVIARLRDIGSIREEDVRFRTKTGAIRQVRLSAELIQVQGESCLLGLSRDVTEQNLLEEQFRQAQKMEAVGRLAGGVAHDFNNLLGVIIGYSELVCSSLPAESAMYKRVDAIKQAGQRAASLTTQLLAFSRKAKLQPRVVNLNTVVTDTGRLLRPLLGEDVEQTVILDPQLGQVKADVGQIVQVLMNLAVNARDAMPRGGKLVIETANAVVGEEGMVKGIPVQPGPYVTLSVKDNGTGMHEETAARIFEPFYTTKPAGKGTGLGLATVYGIVEQSDGCIVVDTAPGEGTTFTIYLPRTDEVTKAPSPQPALAKPMLGSETVLLVEDELALRTVVDDSLRLEGYNVLLASNGLDALHVAEGYQGPIQLLITDVIMPFVSGPELAQSLKTLRPETRVLYMSGYTADKLADHPKLDPALALLQKPFKLDDLAQKVRDLLNDNRAEAPKEFSDGP